MNEKRREVFRVYFLSAVFVALIVAGLLLLGALVAGAQDHENECEIGGRMAGECADNEDLWTWGYYLHRELYYNEAFPAGWTDGLESPGHHLGPLPPPGMPPGNPVIIPPPRWPPFFPYCPGNPCGVCNNLLPPPLEACACVISNIPFYPGDTSVCYP